MKEEGGERKEKEDKKKRRKNEMMRDSLNPGGSSLSHFEEDFLKF